MPNVNCPSCLADFAINGDPEVGQLVVCPRCETQLVIVWLYPLEVDFVDEMIQSDADLEGDAIKKRNRIHRSTKE
jgi:lysine biosynthesis protein LysW